MHGQNHIKFKLSVSQKMSSLIAVPLTGNDSALVTKFSYNHE